MRRPCGIRKLEREYLKLAAVFAVGFTPPLVMLVLFVVLMLGAFRARLIVSIASVGFDGTGVILTGLKTVAGILQDFARVAHAGALATARLLPDVPLISGTRAAFVTGFRSYFPHVAIACESSAAALFPNLAGVVHAHSSNKPLAEAGSITDYTGVINAGPNTRA